MATHSSILAWRIPWTEESGGLQSWGLKEPDTMSTCAYNSFHFSVAYYAELFVFQTMLIHVIH